MQLFLGHLTYNIARNEFKLKFFGSVLRVAGDAAAAAVRVLYVFFVKIGHSGKGGASWRTRLRATSGWA